MLQETLIQSFILAYLIERSNNIVEKREGMDYEASITSCRCSKRV